MAESGYYEKRPRREHRAYLEKRLLERPVVDLVTFHDDFRMVVERDGKSTIYAYITNLYEIGVADVEEILATAAETTCIVSTMDYNHYSSQAKELAKSRGVGLFRSTELLGAVYYDGQLFLEYLPPEERERLRRGRGPQ